MSTRSLPDNRGYTLIEFAVAMSVFMIFMAIAAPFMFSQLRGALETQDRVDRTQNARTALRLMTRELRQATAVINSVDKPTNKDGVSFSVDFNGDGVINSYKNTNLPLEEITYWQQGNRLMRGRQIGAGSVLATEVETATFDLYGSNLALDTQAPFGVVTEAELDTNGEPGLQGPELANVTRVVITVRVGEGTASDQTYQGQALLRNRVS
jgi:prepilin-type N-terminal cleavage/methylation domain-containing protein